MKTLTDPNAIKFDAMFREWNVAGRPPFPPNPQDTTGARRGLVAYYDKLHDLYGARGAELAAPMAQAYCYNCPADFDHMTAEDWAAVVADMREY